MNPRQAFALATLALKRLWTIITDGNGRPVGGPRPLPVGQPVAGIVNDVRSASMTCLERTSCARRAALARSESVAPPTLGGCCVQGVAGRRMDPALGVALDGRSCGACPRRRCGLARCRRGLQARAAATSWLWSCYPRPLPASQTVLPPTTSTTPIYSYSARAGERARTADPLFTRQVLGARGAQTRLKWWPETWLGDLGFG